MQQHLNAQQRFIRVFGMRRSGNHAVIAHLRANAGGKVMMLNKVLTLNQKRSDEGSDIAANLPRGRSEAAKANLRMEPSAAPSDSDATGARLADAVKHADSIIAFLEEQIPPRAKPKFLARGLWHERATNVIVRRGFLNWLASAFMHVKAYGGFLGDRGVSLSHMAHFSRLIEGWKAHASLANRFGPDGPNHVVDFETWVASPAERLALLARLGLPGRDPTLPPLQRFGRGSSFAPDQEGPAPTAAELTSRVLQVADRPGFRDVLRLCLMDRGFVAFLQSYAPEELARTQALANGMPELHNLPRPGQQGQPGTPRLS